MTTFLLTISLLLNGISIYFIFILYSRQNRLLEIEKTQESFKKEIENEISAFLLEMKEENEEFIHRFQQVQKVSQTGNPSSLIKKLEPKTDTDNRDKTLLMDDRDLKNWEEAAARSFKSEAVKVYQKTIVNQGDNMSAGKEDIRSENKLDPSNTNNEEIYRNLLLNQVKILLKQGHTVDEIAKKLNKGKTEIELLLKFG